MGVAQEDAMVVAIYYIFVEFKSLVYYLLTSPALWPNTWPVCIQAYWIHHISFDSHNTLYFSPPQVIFLCQMHFHRLFQSIRHHQPCYTVSKIAATHYTA